jgi:methyltransferase (TIGR00027 family)
MVRAAHLFMHGEPKIFRDGLALQLAGFDSRGELEFAIAQRHAAHARLHGAELARGAFDRARAIIAVRSRYAEDELASARRRGVGQYVILGAGMDSFAWRQRDGSTPLRLFEMDRPRTQHWKRTRLAHMGVALPENLFFVPIDFERQTLREVLDACGYRATEAAFFSCLGVTQYLTAAAVTAMLQSIGSLAPGSEVVFEYIVPEEQLQLEERCYVAAMHPPAVDGTQ